MYLVDDLLTRTGLSLQELADKIKVHKVTLIRWNKEKNGQIPESYTRTIEKLLLKTGAPEPEAHNPNQKEMFQEDVIAYDIDEVLTKLEMNNTEIAQVLGVHSSTPGNWRIKNGGVIPDRYNEKVAQLLEGKQLPAIPHRKVPKLTKSYKKQLHVEEIKEAPKPAPTRPMVALVGSSSDVLSVLREMNLTEEKR